MYFQTKRAILTNILMNNFLFITSLYLPKLIITEKPGIYYFSDILHNIKAYSDA